MAAWEATQQDLNVHPGMAWDLTVDTTAASPQDAVRLIDQLLTQRAGAATA
ncbi:hypothetical protein [Streptomyces rochei]